MTAHQDIVNHILLVVGSRRDVRLWPQNTGVALSWDGQRPLRYGKVGSADISGILVGSGKRIEIEVKIGRDKQSDEQILFERIIRAANGVYVLVHVPDASPGSKAVAVNIAERNLT